MRRQVTIPRDPQDARQFEVDAKRLADSLNFGQDESIFHGSGLEYAQSRLYAPGDPVKSIDWRVSARTGKLFVKEFHESRQIPVYLLMDTSASMCLSSIPLSKYAWAVRIAAGIALAAQADMKPVGLLGCGQRELRVEPSLSRNRVFAWTSQLRSHGFLEDTSLATRARELAPTLKQKAMLIVLSDLHDAGALSALQVLGQKHDCVVLHLQDPAESGLTGAGIFRGMEAESGQSFVGHGRRKWVQSEGWKSELNRFQIDYLHLPTNEPILLKLKQFFKSRKSGLNGAR